MRVISQSELLRATQREQQVLLREITASLLHLAEGSHDCGSLIFRLALARPERRPR